MSYACLKLLCNYGTRQCRSDIPYNQNNISLQNQKVCPNAPCAHHTQPGQPDGLPFKLCTSDGQFPEYSKDKFCRVMASITVDEIEEALMKLLEMQKAGKLPVEREFKCNL